MKDVFIYLGMKAVKELSLHRDGRCSSPAACKVAAAQAVHSGTQCAGDAAEVLDADGAVHSVQSQPTTHAMEAVGPQMPLALAQLEMNAWVVLLFRPGLLVVLARGVQPHLGFLGIGKCRGKSMKNVWDPGKKTRF